jgi:macrolide transport system ATP-binding/permease protein
MRDEKQARDASGFATLAEFANDARHGLRLLARDRLFSIIAVFILSVGVGTGVSIFSALRALTDGSLPGIEQPSRLIAVGRTEHREGFETMSYPAAVLLRERNSVLSDLAMYADLTVNVDGDGRTSRVEAELISTNFFDVIGSPLVAGRGFLAEEERSGSPVAIVSDEFRLG